MSDIDDRVEDVLDDIGINPGDDELAEKIRAAGRTALDRERTLMVQEQQAARKAVTIPGPCVEAAEWVIEWAKTLNDQAISEIKKTDNDVALKLYLGHALSEALHWDQVSTAATLARDLLDEALAPTTALGDGSEKVIQARAEIAALIEESK